MFVVGQKVVCIDDTFPSWISQYYCALPIKDKVYTVRNVELGTSLDAKQEGEIVVHLMELRNPLHTPKTSKTGRERGFKCERFVPLEQDTQEEIYEEEESLVLSQPIKRELVESEI